jgi:hypothetical protein
VAVTQIYHSRIFLAVSHHTLTVPWKRGVLFITLSSEDREAEVNDTFVLLMV